MIDSNCVCFSDALPRGSSLSDRQLLPQRRLVCLLQVHRGARLQVDRPQTHLMGRSVGGGREGASKQTNFMASYIHLDRHLGELEPQDIHTHGL